MRFFDWATPPFREPDPIWTSRPVKTDTRVSLTCLTDGATMICPEYSETPIREMTAHIQTQTWHCPACSARVSIQLIVKMTEI